jgi:O-antigen ligase
MIWLQRLSILMLMLLLLVEPTDGVEGMMEIGGMSLIKLGGVALIGATLLRFLLDDRFRMLPLFHSVFLCFILWVILSYAWSRMPVSYGFEGEDQQVLKGNIYILVIVLMIFQVAAILQDMDWPYAALVAGSGWLAYLMITGHQSALDAVRYEINGLDSNEASVRLALAIPPAIYLLLHGRFLALRVLGMAYLPVVAYTILITGSRTGLVCLLIGLAGLLVVFRRVNIWGKAVGIVAVLLLASFVLGSVSPKTLERSFSVGSEVASGTLNERTLIWRNAYPVWLDSPVVGHGLDAFKRMINRNHIDLIGHNSYITIAVEQGIIGLLLFLGVFLSAGIVIWRSRRIMDEKLLLSLMLLVLMVGQMSLDLQDRLFIWIALSVIVVHAAYSGQVSRLIKQNNVMGISHEKNSHCYR